MTKQPMRSLERRRGDWSEAVRIAIETPEIRTVTTRVDGPVEIHT